MTSPITTTTQDVLADRYRRFTILAGCATIVIGLIGCCSGLVDTPLLSWARTVSPTAYLLAGAAIISLAHGTGTAIGKIGYVLAGLLLVYSAGQTASFFFDASSSGVLSDAPLLGSINATFGTMSPTAAVGFILLALALLTIDLNTRSRVRLSEAFSTVALLVALMTMIGIFFAVPNFCLFISCLKISTGDAAAFLIPCTAVLCARPRVGAFSIMSSPNAGGMMARRLLPAAVLVPVVLGGLKALGQSAHLFDCDMGLTLAMLSMIVVYIVLLWSNARSLDRLDGKRLATAASLEQSEKRVRAIVHQAIDAFVAVDQQGTIRQWNARAAEVFGISESEAQGKKLWQMIANPANATEMERMFAQYGQATLPADWKPVELVGFHADGHEIPLELSIFPVVVNDELITCAFVRDITERKAIEARFRDFYYTVSHELRSPLTSIQGSVSLTQSDKKNSLTQRSLELLQTAEESCRRLIKLINDLLDVKRIEAGKFKLSVSRIDALDVVNQSVENLEGTATLRAITVERCIDAVNDVEGDLDRLVQVLTNLLSNAIKFSPDGAAVIVSAVDTADGGVRFNVIDQGPGIPEEAKDRLFTKFEQVTPTFKQVGSGLGLAISKAIVEEHGGNIGLDSVVGKGSTFWFALPGAKTAAAKVADRDNVPTKI